MAERVGEVTVNALFLNLETRVLEARARRVAAADLFALAQTHGISKGR